MYAFVLATLLTTGNDVPDFGRHGGCRGGCYGGCSGCYGGCSGCWGCYGGCSGCWGCSGCYGGCYGSSSCFGGGVSYGCYGSCYGGISYGSGCYGGISYGSGCCGGISYGSGCFGGVSYVGSCYGSGGYVGTVVYPGAGGSGVSGGSPAAPSAGSGTGGQAGGGGASAETRKSLQELKKSLAELKKEQERLREEALKQVADELRLKATDQKIDELRRAIEELKRRPGPAPVPSPNPKPAPESRLELPAPQAGKVQLDVPADALLVVNGKPIPVTSAYLTPPLQADEEYVCTFEATVLRDGKNITRVKRLPLRAGAEARLAYKDMEPAPEHWTRAEVAHFTVRLPADARLTVDDVECPLTSTRRTFDTPSLVPGREYSYVLKAEMMRDGRRIAQTKRVAFRSGERVTVSFEEQRTESLAAQ